MSFNSESCACMAGLYRYRVGDLLTVSGFYNATPLFRFSGRHGVALCIDSENTSEEVLLKAISEVVELQLRPLGYMLVDSTAYADIYTPRLATISCFGSSSMQIAITLPMALIKLSWRIAAWQWKNALMKFIVNLGTMDQLGHLK